MFYLHMLVDVMHIIINTTIVIISPYFLPHSILFFNTNTVLEI